MSDRHTLLIVDDEDDFFHLLDTAFSPTFEIVRATSTASALRILRERADCIDAMILDMWLPREDGGAPLRNIGLEVLLTAKGRPTHPGVAPEIQVIVMTGHPDLQNAIESQRLGSFRYTVKGSPGMLEVLKRDVEAARSETQGRRIHRAIMDGGRLDLLEPLPLRGAPAEDRAGAAISEIAQATMAVAHVARERTPNTRVVADLLRQIRQLADEALDALGAQEPSEPARS